MTDCYVCGLGNQPVAPPTSRTYEVTCARCGTYRVTHEVTLVLAEVTGQLRPRISEWIYTQNQLGMVPTIRQNDVSVITARPELTFVERVRRLLSYFAERSPLPGRSVNFRDLKLQSLLQTYQAGAVDAIIEYLQSERLLNTHRPDNVSLTGKGIIQAEEWGRAYIASTQGFVAMWFDSQLSDAWTNGFESAIIDAGYRARRIDRVEHLNKICDEVIAEIRRSRFVIADFTGQRGGVYYEAGFAGGRGIPVIWTCKKSELNQLHFDIRQYNCIDWETIAELKERLNTRIEAVIGVGPLKEQR